MKCVSGFKGIFHIKMPAWLKAGGDTTVSQVSHSLIFFQSLAFFSQPFQSCPVGLPGTSYMGNGVSIVLAETGDFGPCSFYTRAANNSFGTKACNRERLRHMSAGLFCFRTFNESFIQFSSGTQSTVKNDSFFASGLSACESSLLAVGFIVIV